MVDIHERARNAIKWIESKIDKLGGYTWTSRSDPRAKLNESRGVWQLVESDTKADYWRELIPDYDSLKVTLREAVFANKIGSDIRPYIIYRGESKMPAVKSISVEHGAVSNISNSEYPFVRVNLQNGAEALVQIRVSDHEQVSDRSPRHYAIDLRMSRRKGERATSYDRRILDAAHDQIIAAVNDIWKEQKDIKANAGPIAESGAAGIKAKPLKSTGVPDSDLSRIDARQSSEVNPESSRAAGGTLASSPARKPNRATQAMRDIIEALPPPHREVLRDLLVNGMSIEDAATKHKLSETAVGHILRRGEAHIRLMLDRAPTKPTVQVQDGIVKATDGRPDLAMSGNAAVAAVDQRRMTPEEVTHAEMQELATRLFDVAPAEAESLVVRWMDSGTTVLSTDGMPDSIKAIVADAQARNAAEMMMTAAAKMLVARKTLEGGNSTQLARLIYLYRNTGTEQARALGMRRDPFDTPEERAAMYLSEALLTPPDAIKNELRRNPANRDRILAAWAKRADEIKAEMLAHGIDLDATFADHAEEQKLVEETIPEPVKPALARAPKKTRQLVKAIMQGLTPAEAIRAAGLTAKAAFKAYQDFRASLNQTGTEAAQAHLERNGLTQSDEERERPFFNWLLKLQQNPHAAVAVSNWHGKVTKSLLDVLGEKIPHTKAEMLKLIRGY